LSGLAILLWSIANPIHHRFYTINNFYLEE
jgi:hypothetical protein